MLYEFAPFEGLRNGEIKFLCELWIRDRQKFYALVSHFDGKAQAIADHISVLVEGTAFGQEMPDEFAQHPGDFFVNMETIWTKFWDMHSGGYAKEEPYDKIYIEADEAEAYEIFVRKFSHDPYSVACSCCGGNYSITEYDNIQEATEYHRDIRPLGMRYRTGPGIFEDIPPRPQDLMPLSEYEALNTVLFIRTGLLAKVLLLPA